MTSWSTFIGLFTQWILLIFILFLLWNFCHYLQNKPLGYQSLLDGANVHFFQYMALAIIMINLISFSFEVADHQINKVWAETLSWTFLWVQQMFFYQLLVCALIRLSLVLNYQSPAQWSDEQIHGGIRMVLMVWSSLVIGLLKIFYGHQRSFSAALQGIESLEANTSVPLPLTLIVGLSMTIQVVSRIIVYFKIGRNDPDPSHELITSKTFATVFTFLFSTQFIFVALELTSLSNTFTLVHGAFCATLLQIWYHSPALRKMMKKKHSIFHTPWMNSNSVQPMIAPIF